MRWLNFLSLNSDLLLNQIFPLKSCSREAFRKKENCFNDLTLKITTNIRLSFHLSNPFQSRG